MKIAIIGAGAMGQLFGARLIDAGEQVVFLDVSPSTVDALNSHGIIVKTPTRQIIVPARAARPEDLTTKVDLAVVFTKGFHTSAAVEAARHLFHRTTIGLTLQNGLGNEKVLLAEFGPERTLAGITDYPADRLGDTVVESADSGYVILGDAMPRDEISTAAEKVTDMFTAAGLNTTLHHNVQVPVWEKLIFNTVLNTIGGATGLTVGQSGTVESARRLADAIVKESLEVARALGIEVSDERIRASLERAVSGHSEHKTSMTVDVEAGRHTEIETIGGAVEAAAHTVGMSTPVLSALCNVIRSRADS